MSSPHLSRIQSLPLTLRSLSLRQASAYARYGIQRGTLTRRYFSAFNPKSFENHTSAPDLNSVNSAEVSHFNALASSWWDPHGSSRLLHLMNALRHKFIRQCITSHEAATSTKLKYLDIGCGGGIFAESAARLAKTDSVTAIDPSPEVIAVAKQHQRHDPILLEQGRLNYQKMAIEDLPRPASPQNAYDIITLFEVIEHIRKPSPFLQNCLQHLKPGGWLIGSTIARTNVSWFTTKVMAEDVLRLVPRGTHEWNQYIQPGELVDWVKPQPDLVGAEKGGWQVMGVVYVPGLGWKEVPSSEEWGNYFFGIKKKAVDE